MRTFEITFHQNKLEGTPSAAFRAARFGTPRKAFPAGEWTDFCNLQGSSQHQIVSTIRRFDVSPDVTARFAEISCTKMSAGVSRFTHTTRTCRQSLCSVQNEIETVRSRAERGINQPESLKTNGRAFVILHD